MFMDVKNTICKELNNLFFLKQSGRKWHLALLASICIGIPLLIGLYFGNIKYGLLASQGSMVILYLPSFGNFTKNMMTILICSLGLMTSFVFGLLFSFNPYVSCIAFGLFACTIHWIHLYYKTPPPGNFFFILVASVASCFPYNLSEIPLKTGLFALGTILSCLLAVGYTVLLSIKEKSPTAKQDKSIIKKNKYADFMEAIIVGVFMFLTMLIGHLLQFKNPYWIPISCAAVMQGSSLYHIWQRSFHRILGTFIGLGFSWILLKTIDVPFAICFAIIILQFIVEILVVRQYAIAVIFITPMTILLTEAANPLAQNPNMLIHLRFIEISIGSILGAIGGWVIYKEKIRYLAIRGIQKIAIGVNKKIK